MTSLDATKLSGTAAINTTGKAAAADKLSSAQTLTIKDNSEDNSGISVNFDGTSSVDLLLPSTIVAELSGNASTATKLKYCY